MKTTSIMSPRAVFSALLGAILFASGSAASATVYFQDFNGFADGTTVLGDGSLMNGGTASIQGNQLRLTQDNVSSNYNSFSVPGLLGSSSGWSATFDITIIDSAGGNPPADGVSFNYGNAALGTLGSGENGMQFVGAVTENISYEIDTWRNFDAEQGVNIAEKVGGVNQPDLAFTNGPILNDGSTVRGRVSISWDPTNGASFLTTGLLTNANFNNVATTFAPSDTHTFILSGRVGGANETLLIDNLTITTSVPEPTTTALLALGLLGAGFARKRRTH